MTGARRQQIPKITMPALRSVSVRARLFRRLDEARRRHPLVWVSAPAGSGKTTLAARWLEARRLPCLWYQLDTRDADPATFFYYLREAVRRLAPRTRETLPLLTPEYALGVEAYARNFFENIAERLPRGGVLVLDNYQDLPEDARLQSVLPVAISALPASVRVVALSRSSPPATFARSIATGNVALLNPEEMQLTVQETLAVARARKVSRVSRADASALHARTGGWLAATVLLLEARSALSAGRAAEATEEQVLFDYFATEIFERAPADKQRLLLATALLPEIDVSAAEALADAPHAGEVLADLVRHNYFTVRLAGTRPRYRLHPLFRQFLLTRARRALDASSWRALAARAADILADAGAPDDAAAILVGAGCQEQLIHLIRAHAPALTGQGRLASLEAWLRALPAGTVESDPWLSYWLGVCRGWAPLEARASFERAYRAFRERDDVPGMLIAWAGFVGTFLFVGNDFSALDPWIAEMEELRRRHAEFPSIDVEAQVTFGMLGSLMWRDPKHPSLEHWLERASALLDSAAPPELRMQLANYVVFYWVIWRGNCEEGDQVIERMRPLIEAPDVTPLTQIFWYTAEANQHARNGDHERCIAAVEQGLAIARRTGVLGLNLPLTMMGIYGGPAAGDDLAAARRHYELAGKLLNPNEMLNASYYHQVGAWIGLCSGDLRSAERHARAAVDCARKTGAEITVVWTEHMRAHVLIERGEHDEAVAMLERCLAWARRMRGSCVDPSIEHHCVLSIAYARLAQGRAAEAVSTLRDGLRIGREQGRDSLSLMGRFLPVHVGIGSRKDVPAKLAALALEHGVETQHVLEMIHASHLEAPQGAPESWPWPVQIRMLGELEVWRGGERVSFGGRTKRKPLDLLRAIVARGGTAVPELAVMDLMWPEADGDAAAHALTMTVHRLRKLIGLPRAVVHRDGRISLDPRICWVDALELSRQLDRALEAIERPQLDAIEILPHADRILALYRGPFPAEDDSPDHAAAAMRKRLRAQLSRFLHRATSRLGPAGASRALATHLARAREVDPGLEPATRAVS